MQTLRKNIGNLVLFYDILEDSFYQRKAIFVYRHPIYSSDIYIFVHYLFLV